MEVVQKLNFDSCDFDEEEIQANSSGCDMADALDSSAEDIGPTHHHHQHLPLSRRLTFGSSIMDCQYSDNETVISPIKSTMPMIQVNSRTPLGPQGSRIGVIPQPRLQNMACSPPYKKVRALRLFDSPATPKTLFEKCSMQTPVPNKCSRLFQPDKAKAMPASYHGKLDKPTANINPFTPKGMLLTARKRTRSKRSLNGSPEVRISKFELDSEESDNEVEQPTKRVALQESNISRYYQEFHELELIGTGEFGSVYKCINRLDGCVYAIKRSNKPVAGINEKNALNEVYAHAVLGKHQHVVRYYSAWAEENHMIIQNEYCNGGSLADSIKAMSEDCHLSPDSKKRFSEPELKQILLHVAEGLRYVHSMQLVHMDIKPGNIFISREKSQTRLNYDSADDGFDEEETCEEEIVYKIGDLGHVTSVTNPEVEEGDCRYLPSEILQNNFNHLTKADIFALGLTIYEAGGGGPLPKNGEEWHAIREGKLKKIPYSEELNKLLKSMVDPEPELRPSAIDLIQNNLLSPTGNKTKAQLRRELNAEKLKNEFLSKQLQEAAKCLKTIAPNIAAINGSNLTTTNTYRLRPTPTRQSNRAVGKKINRSASTTDF